MTAPAPSGPANSYDSTYVESDAEYSPMTAGYIDIAESVPPDSNQRENPTLSTRDGLATAFVPRPPDPSVGGMPGISNGLGWSTGIRNSRAFRQAFDGRTLVVPNMGAHPIQGPVGFSAQSDRLAYGIAALSSDGMPTNAQVGKVFSSDNANAISGVTGGNPNYV